MTIAKSSFLVATSRIANLFICSLLFCSPITAYSGEIENTFELLWETLWHETGTPLEVQKWDQLTVKYRYFGVNLESHRKNIEKILAQTTALAGVKFEDVSSQADSEKIAQFTIEVVRDNGDFPEGLACYVQIPEAPGGRIKKATLRMRDRWGYFCAYHEMMHAMGIKGHPSGDTVLTYFNTRSDKFLELDEFLLKTFYSVWMKPGMTPFQAMDVLTQTWVAEYASEEPNIEKTRQAFLGKTINDMKAFAQGRGELPRILLRSSRATSGGTDYGRTAIAWYLGLAYLQGHLVKPDLKEAEKWFELCAMRAFPTSMLMLGNLKENIRNSEEALERAYYWYTLAETYQAPTAAARRQVVASKLSAETLARLDKEIATFKPR
jgi:hypothetical protein